MWRAINPPTPSPRKQMFMVWGATSCAAANKDGFFKRSNLRLGEVLHFAPSRSAAVPANHTSNAQPCMKNTAD